MASQLEQDLVGIAQYEIAGEFGEWCRRFGWNVSDPEAQRRWARYHEMYMKLWRYLGADEFFQRLEMAKANVLARVGP